MRVESHPAPGSCERRHHREKTGQALTAAAVAERVSWCAALVKGMAAQLVTAHWDAGDVQVLASGQDVLGRPLPAQAWMALRRLGWGAAPPDGVTVNDRIVRMAQELQGPSSAQRAGGLTYPAVIATWPADPGKRTAQEWDAVRAAVPGGKQVPSAVIRARSRQVARFAAARGRLPAGVFDLELPPDVPGTLNLAACDRQQATIERHDADSRGRCCGSSSRPGLTRVVTGTGRGSRSPCPCRRPSPRARRCTCPPCASPAAGGWPMSPSPTRCRGRAATGTR